MLFHTNVACRDINVRSLRDLIETELMNVGICVTEVQWLTDDYTDHKSICVRV